MNILDETWLGIGGKGGFMAVAAGMEHIEGTVVNVRDVSRRAWFRLFNVRIGLGAGWSGGLIAMCVFNCPDIMRLHGQPNSDWGVNLSIGGKWDSVVKALKNYKFFTTIAKIGPKLLIPQAKDLESLRNALHFIYNEYDMATAKGLPKVVNFDIPGAGGGLEVSAFAAFGGKMSISYSATRR